MLGNLYERRSPFIVLIVGYLGMILRYLFFKVFDRIIGNPSKSKRYFSAGGIQTIWNLIVFVFSLFVIILIGLYFLLQFEPDIIE